MLGRNCSFAARHQNIWTARCFRKDLLFKRFESASSSSTPPPYQARKESWITPTMLVVGFIPIFTFALGTWQVQRLQWKVALIDDLKEKLEREPMSLPRHLNVSAIPDFAFRKVHLKGHWDYEHSIMLGPRVRDGTIGYHLVVPLVRTDGTTILVDRGFVSKEFASDAINKQKLEGDKEVELIGMLRTKPARNLFTPDNHPEKGEWFWTDVDAMAEYAGGESAGVQPVFVEEIFEGHAGEISSRLSHGIPIGREPVVDVRNSHASYIATWYSLSALTAVMFVRLLLKQRQSRVRRLR